MKMATFYTNQTRKTITEIHELARLLSPVQQRELAFRLRAVADWLEEQAPQQLRIRVVRAAKESYWYHAQIGQVYEVEGMDNDGDYFVYHGQVLLIVLASDAEIVDAPMETE